MLRKTGLSLAIASALTLSGCFGGSSDDDPAPSSSVVSGTASKGIIVNGRVRAYLFNENGTRASSAIASAITNAEGDYTLSIPSQYRDQPLFISIDYNNGSATMRCDLVEGCGDVAFGEDYDLGNSFSLSAVIPDSSDVVTTNLTPLTTVAALKALDVISLAGSNYAAAAQIALANSSVANSVNDILGTLISDITEVDIIDLTDADDVADSVDDSEALRITAFNAALASVARSESATSIEAAIEVFTRQMADGPLLFNAGESDDVDAVEILDGANAVLTATINALQLEEGDDLLDALAAVGEELEDSLSTAESQTGVEVEDEPSETAPLDEIEQAQAFVGELRNLEKVSLVGDENARDILGDFKEQAEAADMASSDDVRLSVEALGRAASAMVESYKDNFDLETGDLADDAELAQLPGSIEVEGITVNFSIVNNAVTLDIDQSIAVEGFETPADVDITATVASIAIPDDRLNGSAEINLNVLGAAEAETATVSIDQGSLASVTLTAQTTVGNGGAQTVYQMTDLDLALNGTIAQIASESIPDPMTFTGEMTFGINTALRTETSTGATTTLGMLELALEGTFSNSAKSFKADFSLSADATGVTFQDIFNLESGIDLSDLDNNETDSNFVNVTANLLFDAELSAITDEPEVSFDIHLERTGYNDLLTTVRLDYPGRRIDMTAVLSNIKTSQFASTFTLSNNDGVVITVTRSPAGISGTVEVDDVVYGRLGGRASLPTIVYSDGSFESLF